MPRLHPYQPDLTRTIHALGDQHHGGGLTASRRGLYEQGLAKPMARRDAVVAHLMLGDLSNTGSPGDDALFLAHRAAHYGETPVYAALGNHDIYNDVRSPEAAATALGLPARNYTIDLGFVVIVVVFPGDSFAAFNSGSHFSAGSFAWLDATLAGLADRDVWIACHFPLYDTVAGLDADALIYKRSVDSGYYVAVSGVNHDNSDAVLEMLEGHTCVKAWISGHTHSSLGAPDIFTTVNIGARQIPHVNVSSVVPNDKAISPLTQLNTMYLTHRPDGIEIRPRLHSGGGSWNARNGERVTFLEAV